MQLRLVVFALAAAIIVLNIAKASQARRSPHLDRIIIIVLENFRLDRVDPRENVLGQIDPFLNGLATKNRLGSNYFGVSHPSLPNYIAMIGGDIFGIRDSAESCFAPGHPEHCNSVDAFNLVDELQEADIAWEGLFESMPSAGFLGVKFTTDSELYVQRHNPFVYFKNIASDPTRLTELKPLDLTKLKAELADPASASRFIYIVPNQCHDEHGVAGCEGSVTLASGDTFLTQIVPTIVNSPAFTERSVLFIVWDESKAKACCSEQEGGGRIPLIALTKHALRVRSTTPSDHYSLLATIEDGFGLPRIANAREALTLFDLLPDFLD